MTIPQCDHHEDVKAYAASMMIVTCKVAGIPVVLTEKCPACEMTNGVFAVLRGYQAAQSADTTGNVVPSQALVGAPASDSMVLRFVNRRHGRRRAFGHQGPYWARTLCGACGTDLVATSVGRRVYCASRRRFAFSVDGRSTEWV